MNAATHAAPFLTASIGFEKDCRIILYSVVVDSAKIAARPYRLHFPAARGVREQLFRLLSSRFDVEW